MVTESIEEQLPYENRTAFVQAFCANVTSSGLMLRGAHVVRPLTRVAFTVSLVTGQPMLAGHGIVRWAGLDGTGSPLMGIEFQHLDGESLLILDELLAARGHESLSLEPPHPPNDLHHGAGSHAKFAPPPIAPLVRAPPPTLPFTAPPPEAQAAGHVPPAAAGGALEFEAEIEEFGEVA